MFSYLAKLRPSTLSQWNSKVVGLLKLLLLFRDDDLYGLRRENLQLKDDSVSYRLFQPKTLRHGDLTDEYVVSSIEGELSLVSCIRGYLDFTKTFVNASSISLVIDSQGKNVRKKKISDISIALMKKVKVDT